MVSFPGGFVAALRWPPFETLVFDTGGRILLRFAPPPGFPLSHSSSLVRPVIASLSTVPIDGAFLQTFADLRSDTRWLAVYNSEGSFRRAIELTVPLGILAPADPRQRTLLAARRTSGFEFVVYQWEPAQD
jgi:hypothetical protein